MLKALYVPVDKQVFTLEGSLDEILKEANIVDYEARELQVIEGIGIISKKQNTPGLLDNCIEIKGDFILIGINKSFEQGSFVFRGLTDDQLRKMKTGIAYT